MKLLQIPNTYVPYHVHSMLSSGTTNIDSITNFRDYVNAAQNNSMNALGISEHGNLFEWLHKKECIEAAGMKYLHCVEAYLTEDNGEKVIYNAVELVHDRRIEFEKYRQREDGGYLAEVDGVSYLIDIDTL